MDHDELFAEFSRPSFTVGALPGFHVDIYPRHLHAPHSRLPNMATHSLEVLASLLDDRINILEKDVTKYSPAKQVFGTIGAILALARVSALALIHS